MNNRFILWLLIPVFNVVYQVFMKMASLKLTDDLSSLWYAKGWIIGAIISEIISFILWMKILSLTDLSKAFPLSGVSYILIIFTSWFLFHEPVTLTEIVGSILILAGVYLIGTSSTDPVQK